MDVEIRSLVKRYGAVTAVDGLDLTAKAGAVTGFLGRNGAGKTTTMRVLLGLVRPTAGTATLGGRPYHALDHPTRDVGVMLEGASFHPGRRARDHLRVLCAAGGVPVQRGAEVLAEVGLADVADRRVGQFSLGMRQRLALAGALLGEPAVLVLDEPANGLDPEGIAWLRGLLHDFARRGGSVLVSSHVLAEMQQLADEVVIIDRGRLVASGTVADLLATASSGIRARFADPQRLIPLLTARGARVEPLPGEADGVGAAVLVRGVDTQLVGDLAAQTGIAVYELTPVRSSLEDVFLTLTNSERSPGVRS